MNEVKAAVAEIREAANVKSVLSAKGDSTAAAAAAVAAEPAPAVAEDAAAAAATAEVVGAADGAPKTDPV